ncbi:MAG TPA: hypothetical protein VM432_05990, partial [Bdellovibrionales bacterium]|nr:hypothetical protein [Bdellovibrionales bacterium]
MNEVKTYEPILSQIMLAIAGDTRFFSDPPLADVLAQNPKLVVVFNHSSPLSWLPAVSLLAAHYSARGGSHRKPIGVMDRLFFEVPFIKN